MCLALSVPSTLGVPVEAGKLCSGLGTIHISGPDTAEIPFLQRREVHLGTSSEASMDPKSGIAHLRPLQDPKAPEN